jgi:DNA-binding XRE family transcriptional regulator
VLKCSKPKKILQNPQTWGEHIKKRRIEFGLFQSQVAEILGVTECTINNWEKHRSEPMLWVIPKVVEFLGYEPNTSSVKSLGQRIKAYRLMKGITQKELAKQVGIDPTTLSRLERDQGKIFNSTMVKIKLFLQGYPE